jgi:hypothetical protein
VHPGAEVDQLGGAPVEPRAELEDRMGTPVEPLADREHGSSDRRDLLTELEHPVQLVRGLPRGACDRAEIRQHPVDDGEWWLDGKAEKANREGQ